MSQYKEIPADMRTSWAKAVEAMASPIQLYGKDGDVHLAELKKLVSDVLREDKPSVPFHWPADTHRYLRPVMGPDAQVLHRGGLLRASVLVYVFT